jgi:RNA polymerase-binding transcription factor
MKMKRTILKRIKENLLAQRLELRCKTHQLDIDLEGDETDEIQGRLIANVVSQLSSRDRERLQMIENALAKIANKTFGICEECEEPISEKRLETNPYFAICISCAEDKEREAKHMRK